MLRRFFVLPACDWRNPRCLLCYAMFYVSLFSNSKMAAMLSFSPIGAEMAEVHVYLSLFHSVCGGRGRPLQTQLRCGHYGRNILTTPPVSSPDRTPTPPPPRLTPTRLERCVSVRMKCEWSYWALEIINDKWSNCGSDDSSCKYWRKNSYHFILIIFLLFHTTKWTAHAWVLGAQTPLLHSWSGGSRQRGLLQYFCFILFIHHY